MSEDKLVALINDEQVSTLFQSQNHLELAKFLGKELCGFTEDDEKYVDMFWEPAFNKTWIYLTKEMVVNWMGYKDSKDTMKVFYKKLIDNNEENIDYKEVNQNDDLVKNERSINLSSSLNEEKEELDRKSCSINLSSSLNEEIKVKNRNLGGSGLNKKHYIITGECLKGLLMTANTPQGKATRKYFIKVENLSNITNKAIFKYIEYNKANEIKNLEEKVGRLTDDLEKTIDLKNKVHNDAKKNTLLLVFSEAENAMYIGNTESDLKQFLAKLGKSINPVGRNIDFNTNNPPTNPFKILEIYKSPPQLADASERYLHKLLGAFRIRNQNGTGSGSKEQFLIHTEILKILVSDFFKQQEKHVDLINRYIRLLNENDNDFFKTQNLLHQIINPRDVQVAELNNDITENGGIPLFTQKEIDEERNQLLKKKLIKRNEFIAAVKKNNLEVLNYDTRESFTKLKCPENHVFEIIPANHDLHRIFCAICINIKKTKETTEKIRFMQYECLDFNIKRFKCNRGHEFTADYINDMTVRGKVCPVCIELVNNPTNATNNKINHDPESKEAMATNLLLDKKIICRNYDKLEFECSLGHVFVPIRINDLLHKNENCPECPQNKKAKKFHALALLHGGKWKEESPVPRSRSVTAWICKNGHTFTTSYATAEKKWDEKCDKCPCSKNYTPKILQFISKFQGATMEAPDVMTNLTSKVKFKCPHIKDGWEAEIRHIVKDKTWKCIRCKQSAV